MCGIAGAGWTPNQEPFDPESLKAMADVIAHRGPNGEGIHWEAEGCALAHRRLSVIDLEGGAQPLANEDETIWVVFNGEIYNYQELRQRLSNHRFKTNSDTEVIVHLYEEMGINCLREFRGMFALAIWDRPRRRLIIARDRLGKKPLVYRLERDRLLFASEAKSILQVPDVPRTVDRRALHDFLVYQYVPQPRTIFEGIQKLPPAHYGIYEDGELELFRYWAPDFNEEENCSEEEFGQRLRAEMTEATRLRMRSDVPMGAFLSGGIDSTIVVGLMQSLSAQPIQTFSIGFPIEGYDETSYARAAADHLGTNHRELIVTPKSLDILPKLVWHYDEPFGDSSAIPTFYLSQWTSEHVTVALTGDGGDELFGGYPRYQTYDQLCRWERPARLAAPLLQGAWLDRLPGSDSERSIVRRLKHRMSLLNESPERRYREWVRVFAPAQLARMYTRDFRRSLADHDSDTPLLEAFARCQRRDRLTQASFVDMQTYLPGALLAKVDIASMAYGLECRSPMLDHQVVELAMRMPASCKVRGSVRKRILLQEFGDLMPPTIQRRGKMGFCVPLDHWFRDELQGLVKETLLDPVSLSRGYFQRGAIERLLTEHMSGQWNHGNMLWSLLFLEHWHQAFIDAPVYYMAA